VIARMTPRRFPQPAALRRRFTPNGFDAAQLLADARRMGFAHL